MTSLPWLAQVIIPVGWRKACVIFVVTRLYSVWECLLLLMQVFVYKGAEGLSRRFRCAVGFFYGRWYSPVPNKAKLTVLVGKAINVTQVDNPDTNQVYSSRCTSVHMCSIQLLPCLTVLTQMHKGSFVS